MKWIDLPPIWLALCVLLTYLSRNIVAMDAAIAVMIGTILIAVGIVLMILAATQMARHRTTIVPHRQAAALVTSGIFAWSRNPIYLGDALVLGGLSLRWGAPLGLLLVPVFIWIIHKRFIQPEEARLQVGFPDAFPRYMERTRRWV